VNATLRRLAGVITVMFLMLMLAATSVQFFQAGSLNADPRNVRTLYREYGTYRGPIVVAGTPIAYSEPIDDPLRVPAALRGRAVVCACDRLLLNRVWPVRHGTRRERQPQRHG
jgi:hypothetical protein